MKKNTTKGVLLLLCAAFIWGTAFVAQSVGLQYIGTFTYTATRSLMGGLVLLPIVIMRGRSNPEMMKAADRKTTILAGLICGVALAFATNLQQIGLIRSSVGKAGFMTALYIVMVPVLGLLLGKKGGWRIWTAVALAIAGLYFLCVKEQLILEAGDVYLLLCALAFAIQIQAVDHYCDRIDGILLSHMEFMVCGGVSFIAMLLTEHPSLAAMNQAKWSLLYTGILSSGVAYTFQILGQKELEPSVAALIMSSESVISALAGWALLHQVMSPREIGGCVLMFAAIVLAQMPAAPQRGKRKGDQS